MESKTKNLIQISLAIALISVGALVKIPIVTLPITLQPFMVYIIAFSLNKKKSTTAIILYTVLGLIGIPIFANGGGIGYIFQPSFGFILGFILVTLIAGTILEHVKSTKVSTYIITGLICEVFLYIIGITYMHIILKYHMHADKSVGTLIYLYCLPYLPSDILSVVVAGIVASRIRGHI